jgi:crotonobetainyl-CoA:carnitine CoA-transferase CaiB-like acyl-CoA transferase
MGLPVADLATGGLVALAMQGALLTSDRPLEPIAISMEEVMGTWVMLAGGFGYAADANGFISGVPSIGGYGCFRGADGVAFTLGGVEDRFWTEIAKEFELAEDLSLSLADRKLRAPELNHLLQASAIERPAAEWIQRLRARGVPCSLVKTPAEVIAAASTDSRAPIHVGPSEEITLGLPGYSVSEPLSQSPAIGEHTSSVLSWLGLADREPTLRQQLAVF